eukprot:1668323-Rhodomonas_salina.1
MPVVGSGVRGMCPRHHMFPRTRGQTVTDWAPFAGLRHVADPAVQARRRLRLRPSVCPHVWHRGPDPARRGAQPPPSRCSSFFKPPLLCACERRASRTLSN